MSHFKKKLPKKNILVRDISTSKTFSYERGGIKLSFVLNVDDSAQLKLFKSCLETALKDVDELLED